MAYVFGSTFVCQSIDAAKEVLKSLVAFCAFYIVVQDIFFDNQTYSFCSVEYILNFLLKDQPCLLCGLLGKLHCECCKPLTSLV